MNGTRRPASLMACGSRWPRPRSRCSIAASIFGDGVYEVVPVDTVDACAHRSAHFSIASDCSAAANGIQLTNPYTTEQWLDLLEEIIDRHPWPRQAVYVQVTRGVAKRDATRSRRRAADRVHEYLTLARDPRRADRARRVRRHPRPTERWLHCDIKSVSLLATC